MIISPLSVLRPRFGIVFHHESKLPEETPSGSGAKKSSSAEANQIVQETNYAILGSKKKSGAVSWREWDWAIGEYRRALQIDKTCINAHDYLAKALAHRKQFDEALKHCNQIIRLHPDSPRGYEARAFVHLLRKDFKACFDDTDKAIELESKHKL